MHITSYLKQKELEDDLWQTVLETVGPVEIHPACERSLRAWITIGAQRMERQRRLTPEDLSIAQANLRKFIDILKREAVFLGKPNHFDNSTFHAARRRLQRHASLTTFTLWPFWPHNFVSTS
jgi:hypothetical protein